MKRIVRKKVKMMLLSVIVIGIVGGLSYFIYGVAQMYKINTWQNAIGKELPNKFKEILPLKRSSKGWFYITGKVGTHKRDFILDTQARSMARIEHLQSLHASHWGTYPRAVKNLYGQQEKYALYTLDNVVIADGLPLYKPLFSGITQTNALYDLLEKDLLGKDILQHFVWKFSLDHDELILFSNSDADMLREEACNYTKIENGLDEGIPLLFESVKESYKYHFDLGYEGYISINKELYEKLKKKYPQKEYLVKRNGNLVDTTFMLTNVPIRINDLWIPDCKVTYRPGFDTNLLGVGFIERFNFMLGYQKGNKKIVAKEDLYLQLRRTASKSNDFMYCPSKGFDVEYSEDGAVVSFLEINGEASRKGLKIGDKVLEINHGAVCLSADSIKLGKVTLHINNCNELELKIKKNNKTVYMNI